MATYLFTWNPNKFNWYDIEEDIVELKEEGWHYNRWSCGRNKRINIGDRFYLIRLGNQVFNKGIVGSGVVTSRPFEDLHWEDQQPNRLQTTLYVDVKFDMLLDAEIEQILEMDFLKGVPILNKMHWSSQTSGIRIPDEIATELQVRWSDLLSVRYPVYPVEETGFVEGEIRHATLTRYERSALARKKCVDHYGAICMICGFNFGERYGPTGEGFIHVHHLVPISEIGYEYRVDPISDLVPVCPNCHAIIHSRTPSYSVEEVMAMLNPV